MEVTLVTSCSNRKSIAKQDRISSSQLTSGSLSEIAKSWKLIIDSGTPKISAGQLYTGRGFKEAKNAANKLKADHWVISVGLGLVHISQKVAAYDLSVSGSGDANIKNRMPNKDFNSQVWWQEINKNNMKYRSLSDLIKNSPTRLFIFAVPSNYFQMISADLKSLKPIDLNRVRIIGPTKRHIPSSLLPLYLPYDERLNGPLSPIKGTRSDFPQRVAHHFSEHIWPAAKSAPANIHAELVLSSMQKMNYPSIPIRNKKSNDEILDLIKKNWTKASGQTGRLLRIIRDDELVACEQGRFKDLVHVFKAKETLGNRK